MRRRVRTVSATSIEIVASNWILRRDAGLTLEEEAEFQRWQTDDPRHADAVTRKDKAWSALDRPLHSGQAKWLIGRLGERAAKRRRQRIGVAAAGVAVLLVAMTFVRVPRDFPSDSANVQGAVILPETRTLPDGTLVELRPGADVAVDFSGRLRRVLLKQGEAYFQVAKNEDWPFVVTAGAVEFRAIGTAFSVELGGEHVDVLVTEGRVAVEKSEPEALAQKPAASKVDYVAAGPQATDPGTPTNVSPVQPIATVDAGKRLVVGLAAPAAAPAPVPTVVSASEITERLAWRAPKLEFSDLPLDEAVVLINRYNKVQFMIEDAALVRLRISGFFRADNVDTFVRLLEGTCGIQAERSGDTIRLRKASQ